MREIKFRGQCVPDSKYAGEWVEGSLVVCDDGSALIVCAFNDHNMMKYHVVPETVGQFTEQKDKNDNEVFVFLQLTDCLCTLLSFQKKVVASCGIDTEVITHTILKNQTPKKWKL